MKDILVRAKLLEVSPERGSKSCGKGRCKKCPFIKDTDSFSDKSKNKTYKIKPGKLNCDSQFVIYLLECKKFGIQYVGSCVTKFRLRLNNYLSSSKRFLAGKSVAQAPFPAHFAQDDHDGEKDWVITLIDQGNDEKSVRKKKVSGNTPLIFFHHLG